MDAVGAAFERNGEKTAGDDEAQPERRLIPRRAMRTAGVLNDRS